MNYDLTFDIFKQLSTTSCKAELEAMIDKAVTYARIRVDDLRAAVAQRHLQASNRTATHDSFIASCMALAEAMKQSGEDASWHDRLGNDRKNIGDFACFLHCILGLIAR